MKKVSMLFTGLLFAGVTSFAQMSIDPEVGMNFNNIRTKIDGADAVTDDAKVGFSAGAGLKINLADGFYVKPGLNYSLLSSQSEILSITTKSTYHYLQLPVNLGYELALNQGNAGHVFAEAGPYLGYALSGKHKVDSPLGSVEKDIEFGKENNETKPFDWGFKFGIGYETPWNIFVKGGYTLGLGNLSNVDNLKINQRNWNVSIGYRIAL